MTDFGLIHGDIKRSNVVFDGIKLNLIDWEPSFKLYFEALIKIAFRRRLIKK
jgi:Ser/Thr protein kinase RdoA (MazF antagonist)